MARSQRSLALRPALGCSCTSSPSSALTPGSASGNHPFYKLSGWERLDKLKTGDVIASPRELRLRSKVKHILSDDRLILLAHLIGDGCFVKGQPLYYTNSEMELIKIVQKSAMKEFDIVPRIIKQENWFHIYLSSRERLTHGRRNPICKWLDEDMFIYGQRSREKIIPEPVFLQDNKKIALFLKHLWSTDGCIHLYKGKHKKVSLYYASGSRELAEGVLHLLLRFGIISTITFSKKNGYKDIYNVQINGKENQSKYMKYINFVGIKAKKSKEALDFLNKIKSNPNNDVTPREIWENIEEIGRNEELTTREFQKRMGWAYSGTQRLKNGIGRDRLNKIGKVLSDDYLIKLANSDLYWDKIEKIEKVGIKDVYDMTVPKYANFIANDIIVHNSIEQDADVVMFLWREDDENSENMMLDIAKHRNGPLTSVPLHFKGDRIKFFGRERKHKE